MKSLAASQAALLGGAVLRPIPFLVIQTYSDRALSIADKTYYLSDRATIYPYGGTAVQFEPMLLGIADTTPSMPNLPTTTPAGLSQDVRVTLSNGAYQNGYAFIRELRAHNFEFATVELSTVYGPVDPATGWYDLSAYAGTEHHVEFRGEIQMAEGIDGDSFQVRITTPEHGIGWLFANDSATVDPKDLGSKLPVPYGATNRTPCINWKVGWLTVLSQPLSASQTSGTISVGGDMSGFPAGTFLLRIDSEEMTISAFDDEAKTLTILARGVNGTTVADHAASAVAIEIPDLIEIVVSDAPASAIDDIEIRSPFNNQLFSVRGIGTEYLSTTDVVPGRAVAAVTFDQSQQSQMLDLAFTSFQMTQQAEYISGATPVAITKTVYANSVIGYGVTSKTNSKGFAVTGAVPTLSMKYGSGGAVNRSVKAGFTSGLTSAIVQRWRVVLSITVPAFANSGTAVVTLAYGTLPGVPGGNNHAGLTLNFATGPGASKNYSVTSEDFTFGRPETDFLNTYCEISFNGNNSSSNTNEGIILNNWHFQFDELETPPLTRAIDAKVIGASVGYGLDFYASVSGPSVPASYVPGYAFDVSTGWTTSGCTVSADASIKTEGASSVKLTAAELLVEDCEAVGSWIAVNGSMAVDTATFSKGAGSFALTSTSAVSYIQKASGAFGAGLDFRSWLIAFDVRVTSATGGITTTAGVFFGVCSEADFSHNQRQWSFGAGHGISYANGWRTVIFDPDTFPYIRYSAGTVDYEHIKAILFGLDNTTPGSQIWIDNIRRVPKLMVAQRNATSGVVNLSASPASYRVDLRGIQAGEIGDGSYVTFSNTAGSGITLPAAYRLLSLSPGDFGAGAFVASDHSGTDTGSPTVTDVEMVRVQVTINPNAAGILIDTHTVWIDNLVARDDSANPYSADVGDLIEHPADIVRHLLTVRAGLASTYVDDTTCAAWVTNTPGGFKMAFDARALGDSLIEVLARIGYEGRANIVRLEGATTSVFKAFCAEAGTTWPAANGRVLTLSQDTSEVGRDGRELATRFRIAYARDPSLGTDLSSYTAQVRADPDVSDVSTVTTSDLTTREQKYGRRDADVAVLLCIQDEDTALDVAGYLITTAGQAYGLFLRHGAPWWEAGDLELGDVIEIEAPSWRAATVKVRVIEAAKKWATGLTDVRVHEVE